MLALLVAAVSTPTASLLPREQADDASARRDVLSAKAAVFDLFHNLTQQRQKAKAILSDPALHSQLFSAYHHLQDGESLGTCVLMVRDVRCVMGSCAHVDNTELQGDASDGLDLKVMSEW